MANYRAVAATLDAVASLLECRYERDAFGGKNLKFMVYQAKDFARPMQAGVSAFLYRICVNRLQHNLPGGRITPDGQRSQPPLPLEMHFLLTAWAKDASLQHTIAGWMMRVMNDVPILNAEILNRKYPETFHSDEVVEIMTEDITPEALLLIWERTAHQAYELSMPYTARFAMIE